MNNGEKMENARYATNDDTAVFIDQAHYLENFI
jgi:hypothetical protein